MITTLTQTESALGHALDESATEVDEWGGWAEYYRRLSAEDDRHFPGFRDESTNDWTSTDDT